MKNFRYILALLGILTLPNITLFAMVPPTAAASPIVDTEQAIIDAIKEGKLETLKQIFEREKTDPNKILKNRGTALIFAAANGHEDIVRYLVTEKRAYVNVASASFGRTALIHAALGGHFTIVKFLVDEAKAQTQPVDRNGYSALYYAAQEGHLDIVKYLVEHESFTPIYNSWETADDDTTTAVSPGQRKPSLNISGVVALSLAYANKNDDIVDYLISKGFSRIPKLGQIPGLENLFYSASANAHCDLNIFELIAYHKLQISPSRVIEGLQQGGTLHIYQPRVLNQGSQDDCKEQLEKYASKLGGTPKMHKDANPIYGGTCSYHANKNALLGLLMLHNYEHFVELCANSNDEKIKKLATALNTDIKSFTQLKTNGFNSEKFIENLHAKTLMIKQSTFRKPEAPIEIQQSFDHERAHITRHDITAKLDSLMKERYQNSKKEYNNSISFIHEGTMKAVSSQRHGHIYESRFSKQNAEELYAVKDSRKDLLSQIDQFDLLQQISLFRTNNTYRHAFVLSHNTETAEGYYSSLNSRMHAISLIVDKRGSTINVIICESNNVPQLAIKRIVFDFIELFTNEKKCSLSAEEVTLFSQCAQNKFGCWFAAKQDGLPSFSSLVDAYILLRNKSLKDTDRKDIHLTFFFLSELQHICDLVTKSNDIEAKNAVQAILQQNGLTITQLRQEEIQLHNLIELIEKNELNQRITGFIYDGNEAQLKAALTMGADINACHDDTTPLGRAVMAEKIDLVECLLKLEAKVDGRGKGGHTPLMLAAQQANAEIINLLIQKGADVNAQDDKGFTPAMYAAKLFAKDEIIKLLIEKYKANCFITTNNGISALIISAVTGNANLFRYLVSEHKIPFHLKILIDFLTAEQIELCGMNHSINLSVELIDYLIKVHGLTMEQHPECVKKLFIPAMKSINAKDIIKRLLEPDCGIQIDMKDENGYTPLMHSLNTHNPDIVLFLIKECHADVSLRNNAGQTAFDLAAQNCDTKVLDYLIKNYGYTLESTDQNGHTALLLAAARCNYLLMQLLKEYYNANIHATDAQGRTALMLAAGQHLGQMKCKAKECSDNKKNDRMSRVSKTDLDLVKYLVDNGCNVNSVDKNGYTALMHAASAGRDKIVAYLIQNGADINMKNNDGKTALDLAVQAGHQSIIELLKNPKSAQ